MEFICGDDICSRDRKSVFNLGNSFSVMAFYSNQIFQSYLKMEKFKKLIEMKCYTRQVNVRFDFNSINLFILFSNTNNKF